MLPLSLRAYRYATTALAPIAPLALRRRARRGKESPDRLGERMGFATCPRPEGDLVWIHAASVGECLSVLGLIEALLARQTRSILLTSGTLTSAVLMGQRLPDRALHQFAPVDTPSAVARFLDHWKPDAGLFVDSEIWPNMLLEARQRGIGLGLINGRMSQRSYDGWRKAPGAAKALLALYDICLAQDDATASRLEALGARDVRMTGSLKADAPPLPYCEEDFHALSTSLRGRPLLLAASTHPGEEPAVLAAHDRLRARFASLLTIIVPRHPERGFEIAALCADRAVSLRSQTRSTRTDLDVYVGDTMGELGLFYRLAPFAFIGGSLVPHGGQNPIEAVKLGSAVLAGPYTDNFATAYEAIFAAQGIGRVTCADELAAAAATWLADDETLRREREAAGRAVAALGGALERTRLAVEGLLDVVHARA